MGAADTSAAAGPDIGNLHSSEIVLLIRNKRGAGGNFQAYGWIAPPHSQ
jgi:hypothetical protein